MNLENYTCKALVAVRAKRNGKFAFVCESTEEGRSACYTYMKDANDFLGTEEYELTFFSCYIKTPHIEW